MVSEPIAVTSTPFPAQLGAAGAPGAILSSGSCEESSQTSTPQSCVMVVPDSIDVPPRRRVIEAPAFEKRLPKLVPGSQSSGPISGQAHASIPGASLRRALQSSFGSAAVSTRTDDVSTGSTATESLRSGDKWALLQMVSRLEDQAGKQETEAAELRTIIATKDGIIRKLGARLEAAEGAETVVRTKDEIIRELGLELGEARASSKSPGLEQQNDFDLKAPPRSPRRVSERSPSRNTPLEHGDPELADLEASPLRRTLTPYRERSRAMSRGTSSSPDQNAGDGTASTPEALHTKSAGDDTADRIPFSVFPVDEDSVLYQPVPWSAVDKGIATFSNARSCRVLFTRLDDNNYYLYGRMLVHCALFDNGYGRNEVYVSAADLDYMPLNEFVERYEGAEHEHFELVFSAMELARHAPG